MKRINYCLLAVTLSSTNAFAQETLQPYFSLDLTQSSFVSDVNSDISDPLESDTETYNLQSSLQDKKIGGGLSVGTKISYGSFFVAPELFYIAQDNEDSNVSTIHETTSSSVIIDYQKDSSLEIKNGNEYGANMQIGYSGNNNAIYAIAGIQKRNVDITSTYVQTCSSTASYTCSGSSNATISTSDSITLDDLVYTYGVGFSSKLSDKITTSLEYKVSETEDYSLQHNFTNLSNNSATVDHSGEYGTSTLSLRIAYYF